MGSPGLSAGSLSVEVSGWDEERKFFVEKSDLGWGEAGHRTVLLHCRLHVGSMVFVRLLASTGLGKGYPVAHRAEFIEPCDLEGAFRVRLVESQPRRAEQDVPIDPLEHLIGIGERTER